jgi:hypothetical protein
LERLYDVYDSLCGTGIIFNEGKWLLDDDTKLKISCKASHEEDLEMSIIISEKDLSHPIRPLWFCSKK